jgi:hypothetical protein
MAKRDLCGEAEVRGQRVFGTSSDIVAGSTEMTQADDCYDGKEGRLGWQRSHLLETVEGDERLLDDYMLKEGKNSSDESNVRMDGTHSVSDQYNSLLSLTHQ